MLRCPVTKQSLVVLDSELVRAKLGGSCLLTPREGTSHEWSQDEMVLATEDLSIAYAVVADTPILLGPERLRINDATSIPDADDKRYAEAYAEMAHYNAVAEAERQTDLEASSSATLRNIGRLRNLSAKQLSLFPEPLLDWLDATYDLAAEGDIHRFFGSVGGRRVLQIGGSGSGAIKFLLAGAAEAWLISPMVGEIALARSVARSCRVVDRLFCVAGVAEELPFADGIFDLIWASGSVHHTATELAFPEAARVLKPGGRFGAVEPWRSPGYGIGTRVLGKRESGAQCQPLTDGRVAPLYSSFATARVVHHGSLTRYPLIALGKFGIVASAGVVAWMTRLDDRVSSTVPGLRRLGSSVALLAMNGR